jgi:LysR family transcriptional regulator, glycine cleavage system transcriptional activator
MRRLPPLTELRAFEAAARHLSFKAAAAELGVTPTAISHQIRLLEQHCGQKLFHRQPRPMTLTKAGETLSPMISNGLNTFADALATIRAETASGRLRVTATNAFAARWIVPRLPLWRQSHPHLRLEIIGTDTVLNLNAGEVDIAIRYAATLPSEGVAIELMRDTFHVVGSPSLVGKAQVALSPQALAGFPLIECDWPSTNPIAPTWERWEVLARKRHRTVPPLGNLATMSFREELHAIEAAIAGQWVAICSDVLVGRELADGTLVRLSTITLPGFGFFIVHRPDHRKQAAITAFSDWARSAV